MASGGQSAGALRLRQTVFGCPSLATSFPSGAAAKTVHAGPEASETRQRRCAGETSWTAALAGAGAEAPEVLARPGSTAAWGAPAVARTKLPTVTTPSHACVRIGR